MNVNDPMSNGFSNLVAFTWIRWIRLTSMWFVNTQIVWWCLIFRQPAGFNNWMQWSMSAWEVAVTAGTMHDFLWHHSCAPKITQPLLWKTEWENAKKKLCQYVGSETYTLAGHWSPPFFENPFLADQPWFRFWACRQKNLLGHSSVKHVKPIETWTCSFIVDTRSTVWDVQTLRVSFA